MPETSCNRRGDLADGPRRAPRVRSCLAEGQVGARQIFSRVQLRRRGVGPRDKKAQTGWCGGTMARFPTRTRQAGRLRGSETERTGRAPPTPRPAGRQPDG